MREGAINTEREEEMFISKEMERNTSRQRGMVRARDRE